MDLSQLNSIATSGTSAASTVASALSSRRAVQADAEGRDDTNQLNHQHEQCYRFVEYYIE